MRILYLSAYYDPEIAASSYIFDNIKESYAEAGHEILVYAPVPTRGISSELRRKYIKRKYEKKHNGNLKIYRFTMFREGQHPVGRAFRYLCCNFVHVFKGLLAKKIDIICVGSTPPTQGALAVILKKFKNVPVVYYLQDIFPDSLVNAGLTKQGSLLWKIGRKIENFTYKNIDKIIVISEDMKQNIMAKGVPEEKLDVIYNWVDENAVINVARSNNKLFDKYNMERSKFYITYCGNIGFSQNMDMLLEVVQELKQYDDIAFVLVGDGAYRTEVEKQIAKKHIKNIKILPFQPYEDISQVFSLGDVGLIISKANVGQNSVPSKTWSIMSAERPILASFDIDSELSSIIKQANCGLCVQPGEKGALVKAILYLFENSFEARLMGKNGRKYILNNLTREIGTSKYVRLLDSFRCSQKEDKHSGVL
jgi:glycosyltransferase involved in cell wall biosynthesis